MRQLLFVVFITLSVILFFSSDYSFSKDDRYNVVIEESYYKVKPENEDKFLELYKTRVFPFWKEIEKMGLIEGEVKLYTQRLHTLKPSWTFKTVVRFKNYTAIDKWLEKREEVFNELFPNEGGYKKFGKQIRAITEEHWDEFIREVPLE
jgi:hypothetical protein